MQLTEAADFALEARPPCRAGRAADLPGGEPVRVLQVLDSLGMGGAETWLMQVLRHWHATGAVRMDFVLTGGKRAIFDDEAERLGAKLFYVKFSRRSVGSFAREFRRILRAGNYHAIHDHSDYASGWHYLIGMGCLPAVRITHVHNPAFQISNVREINASRKIAGSLGRALVARLATNIAGTSRQVIGEYGFNRAAYRQLPVSVLHCGFDPARFALDRVGARHSIRREFSWPAGAKIVLFAGRMDASPDPGHPQNHKNSGFALAVAMECARRDEHLCAIFAGKPTAALSVLEQRVASAGLAPRIRFVGIRTDIDRLMAGCDALLFPSVGEGLGMVAVEAQAAGLPVLASTAVPRECIVVPELVRFRGLTSPIEEWAEDLLQLCRQPRDPAGANARVAASPFSIQYSAHALLHLYTS